jgi:hypothetical protein
MLGLLAAMYCWAWALRSRAVDCGRTPRMTAQPRRRISWMVSRGTVPDLTSAKSMDGIIW